MSQQDKSTIQEAYRYCTTIVRNHYENFPVASLLLPRKLRMPITAIYAFARTADDIADEGDQSSAQRLKQLTEYNDELKRIHNNSPTNNRIFIALNDTIHSHQLPIQLFFDLVTAFTQDVTKTRYDCFDDVLQYCHYSANPVGRLLLHLTGQASDENLIRSDSICSALQLINFLQDISQDFHENNRIYLPLDEMAQYQVTETHIKNRISDTHMLALFKNQVARAKQMMLSGAPLGSSIPGRFGFQLRLMIAGGLRICNSLENLNQDCFARPRLTKADWLEMVKYAIIGHKY